MAAPNTVRLQGLRFGALVVLKQVSRGRRVRGAWWLCKCDCGKEVVKRGDRLRQGRVKTCALAGHSWLQHKPMTLPRLHPLEYSTWSSMRERCLNPKCESYPVYGGRGITICEAWSDFTAFLRDMGRRPTRKHTINRKNNEGNYEPGNCRWATRKEQARNTQRSVHIVYEGEQMLLVELTEKLGLDRQIVYGRLNAGWSLDEALTIPVKKYRKKVSS